MSRSRKGPADGGGFSAVNVSFRCFAAGLAAFVIAVAVMSLRTIRAAAANPVESIRYE